MGLGRDVPGRLGSIARELGDRMERGASLDKALRDVGPAIPESYRAVVEAGCRAGRLPTALEGVAAYARGYAELRRVVGGALFYPTVVLLLGYGLLLAFLWYLLPRIVEAFVALGLAEPWIVDVLERLAGAIGLWGPLVPLIVLAGALAWWAMGRARGLDAVSALGWVPWLGSVLRDARAANFASWLSLLIEHDVPLPEALELAGRASGDRALDGAARDWAAAARRGEPMESVTGTARGRGARPLLRWLLSGSVADRGAGRRLAGSLAQASRTYRARAVRKAEEMATVLPSTLLLVIGGMTALLYTLLLVAPWTKLLQALAEPPA
jgi:type II secretory pathway component PulF